jgi:hypothetical protein
VDSRCERYTVNHSTFVLLPQLSRTAVVVDDPEAPKDDVCVVMESRGAMRLALSLGSIRCVANEELSARISGFEIEPTFAATFHFDGHARLACLDFHIDLCTAFIALLGSPSAAAVLAAAV